MDLEYIVCRQWLYKKLHNKSLADFFRNRNVNKVAIYGVGYLGDMLITDLENTDVQISYIIDRNAGKKFYDYECYYPSDRLPETDAVVVTPIRFFDGIKTELMKYNRFEIISLEEIVYSAE